MPRDRRLRLMRPVGHIFVKTGAVACAAYLILALPAIYSFTGFLLVLTDVIGRLSSTVGLGAVLLALAEIADGLERPE